MLYNNPGDKEVKRRSNRNLKDIERYANIDINIFSLKKYSRIRVHEVTLVTDQCRLDTRKYSFTQRTITE